MNIPKKFFVRSALVVIAVLAGGCAVGAAAFLYLNGRTNGTLLSSGEARQYLIYVPESYDQSTPTPLVISLHGVYLWPGFQERLTGWNELADMHGFIVVYPAATGLPRSWRVRMPSPELRSEVLFFSDLIDDLSIQYNIDPSRIYANGYSNGAAMTFLLSCTLSDRIAAFGMVATAIVDWEWCEDRQPVPMIAFHGTADPLVPYEGGENWLTTAPLIGIGAWLEQWGLRNRCNDEPLESKPATDVVLRQYIGCAEASSAALYTIQGAGHIWPGGTPLIDSFSGPFSDSVNATSEMWAFFADHPLTERQE